MTADVELSLRSPQAFPLARFALETLERQKIWPTPLNFELWLHYLGEPRGALATAIDAILAAGQPITEEVSEELAAEHLPRLRLNEQIRDAGDLLKEQLDSVSQAIDAAQLSSASYERTLDGAGRQLDSDADPVALKVMVAGLASATRRVQRETGALERKLSESNTEVRRLREHLEQVRRDSMTDSLTSLPNRKAFDEGLEAACAEAEAAGGTLSLAVLDIDLFKRFNDTWGHQTGDQVIRYVASVLAQLGRAPRLAARFGGEEFAVIFPAEDGSTVVRALNEVRERIGSRLLKRRSTNEELGRVTVSAGVAQWRPGDTPQTLIGRADEALYVSKRTGRNRVSAVEDIRLAAA